MNTQYAYAYVHKGWAQAEVLKIIFFKILRHADQS